MQFQVPQFIDIEDKIFGPLTFKQFVYLAGGTGISFVLYVTLPLFISFLLILPVVIFSVLLAFYKINKKPFISTVESAVKYSLSNKLYTWKRQEKKAVKEEVESESINQLYVPKLSDSKLKDLSWSLDVHKEIQ